jgi:hypothetical protein
MIAVIVSLIVLIISLIIGAWYIMNNEDEDVGVDVGEDEDVGVDEEVGTLYVGNNGTVSGDTYCAGDWGSVDGKTNKNMTCVKTTDAATGAILECSKSYATAAGLRPTSSWCI